MPPPNMTNGSLLESLLDRLGRAGTEAFFGADEVADWPRGGLNWLLQNGLLRRAQPAHAIECQGCEENCVMPVHVFPAEGDLPARALISCDKRDDVGRVPVDLRRLEQWQATGDLIAAAVARLLGFVEPTEADGKQWYLGVLKGRRGKTLVTLLADRGLKLSLAGHILPLGEVLTLQGNVLTLDKGELMRRVDTPAGNAEGPEQRRDRLKTRVHEEKAKGTRGFLKKVAAEEGITATRLKQIIYKKTKPTTNWSGLAPSSKKTKRPY